MPAHPSRACVEGAPAADAANANGHDDEERPAAHLSLPPLNMLARQHLLSEEEVVAGNCLPLQRRVTTQIMRNWQPHLTAQAQPPSTRCQNLRMLHSKVTVNATSRAPEDAAGHGNSKWGNGGIGKNRMADARGPSE